MFRIDLTDGAKADLRDLMNHDKAAGLRIVAILEEINEQNIPPDRILLRREEDGDFENFTVRFCLKFFAVDGLKVWGIKTYWDTEPSKDTGQRESISYRALFAPIYDERRYMVLGILHREKCYEAKGKKYKRIRADYDRLGCNSPAGGERSGGETENGH